MKKLSRDEMKNVLGGKGGCDDGDTCRFTFQCPFIPGYVDYFCDTGRRVCVYCY